VKVLIVDDEQLARERLVRMVRALDGHEVVGEAGNGVEALDQAQRTAADVVLLDIRMPGMDGLETARHLAEMSVPPAVIFCTAYDQHALQAFELQAVGYLLKPVRRESLAGTLDKAQRVNKAQLAALGGGEPSRRSHIPARTHRGIELIPVEEIRYFLADQKYVSVGFGGGRSGMIIDEPLKDLEREFADLFVRVHRNALVASGCIESLERLAPGHGRIRLRGVADPLEVSRRHLPDVRRFVREL
jgi:two-component system, LytTR family, response regulator AlgR